MTAGSVAVTDGRVLRGARTRSNIVQALLGLLDDGVLAPTAAQIADRAGVSVRSVFQHFRDMEALYADLAAEQRQRVAPLMEGLDADGPLERRIALLVAQRRELYETIRPVRHAIGTRAFESAALRARLEEISAALRAQVASQFETELRARKPGPRRTLLDSVDMATSFEAWDRLREYQGLAADRAAAVVASTLGALLG